MENGIEYEYNFDFSGHGYDIEEQKQDNAFNDYLRKAMKKREKFYKPTTLNPFKIEHFILARDELVCIANANLAKIKISMKGTTACASIESSTITIRSESEKESIINVSKLADYVTIKANESGKVILNAQFDLARD